MNKGTQEYLEPLVKKPSKKEKKQKSSDGEASAELQEVEEDDTTAVAESQGEIKCSSTLRIRNSWQFGKDQIVGDVWSNLENIKS